MKKDDRVTIIVIILICFICFTTAFLLSRKSNFDKLSLVSDYDTFFSVSDEVNRYINYVTSSDKVNIYNLLSEKFVEEYSVNYDNIFDFVNSYSGDISLRVNSIYFDKIRNNYLYLVNGTVNENSLYGVNVIDDDFKIVVLNDISSNSYSIYPVDEGDYKDVINGIRRISISNNSSNTIVTKTEISDVDICKLYFSDYMDKILNDVDGAYDLLDESMISNYSSIDDFKKFLNEHRDMLTTSSNLCGADELKDQRIYTVVDKFENVYTFKEQGVMNYKVSFRFKDGEE